MIKLLILTSLGMAMLFGLSPNENKDAGTHTTNNKLVAATCYGKTPCTACSNCSACKHCKGGGTCGKCVKGNSTYKSKAPATAAESNSGQCKATTKKGTRCKRSAESGGYCWQHG